ncbi:MAG: MBL fold metallo-hydrolase [Gemmatimonadetes bacterium]|nr:MBL fold metallo-hydrolase [Gemmatimonadota bacterium]
MRALAILMLVASLGCIVLPATQTAAQSAARPATPADTANYALVRVAAGVYAFIAPPGITPMVSGNSTVVIGDSSVLVVDNGQFPSVVRWQVAKIRALTPLPVRFLVTTHWHADHWLGNGVYRDAFPDITMLATPATARQMEAQAPTLTPAVSASTRAAIGRILAAKAMPDGQPMTADAEQWYRFGLAELEALAPDLPTLRLAYPTRYVPDSVVVDLGRRVVVLRHGGPGNTEGDLTAWIPDVRTLVTGDLVVRPYPYVFGSFVTEWRDRLRELDALGAQAIVPGHGEVMRDGAYLRDVSALLSALHAQAAAGATRLESADFFERMCPTRDGFCAFGFRISMAAGLERAKAGLPGATPHD